MSSKEEWAQFVGGQLDSAMYELRKSGLSLERCCSRHLLIVDPVEDEVIWETDVV